MRLLVIIPAYNEAENIQRVVENLRTHCPQHDIVVVDDGSRDDTAAICLENGFPLLSLPVNLGLTGAIGTGMKYAYKYGYDAAVQFDADGQHRPEYIAPMLEKLAEGRDIVIGSRFAEKRRPLTPRMLGSRLLSLCIFLTTGTRLSDPTSGMRMFSRRIIREFATEINHSPEPDTISYLIKKGAKVAEVQVEMDERKAGESYFNSVSSMKYMLGQGVSILLVQWFRLGKLADETPAEEAGEDR